MVRIPLVPFFFLRVPLHCFLFSFASFFFFFPERSGVPFDAIHVRLDAAPRSERVICPCRVLHWQDRIHRVLARLAACCRRLHTLATMHPVLWKLGTLYRHQSAWRRRQQAASVWRLAHPSPPYHAERASIVKQLLGVQHPRADFSLLVDEGKDRERRVIYTLHGYDAIRRELLWECHDSHGCARRAHAVGFFHNGPSSVIRDRRVCVPVEGLVCVACAAGCDDKCGLLCHCGATPPPTLTRPRARSGRGH